MLDRNQMNQVTQMKEAQLEAQQAQIHIIEMQLAHAKLIATVQAATEVVKAGRQAGSGEPALVYNEAHLFLSRLFDMARADMEATG